MEKKKSALSNKLLIRSANYLDQQLRVPLQSTTRDKEQRGGGDKERDGSSSSQRGDRDRHRDSSLSGPSKYMTVEELFSWYSKLLDSARMRHRKTQRFCRKLTQRFDNSAEYSIEDTDVDTLVETLQDTGHFLVYTGKFEAKGTYIVADGSLWGQPDDVRHLLRRVFSVTIPGSRVRPRQTISQVSGGGGGGGGGGGASMSPNGQVAAQQHNLADSYPEVDDVDDEALATYILLISPRQSFVWSGAVMTLDVDYTEYDLPDNRVRLIADGPTKRLAFCKHYFEQALIHPETGEKVDLPCVIEAQAHLPMIQKQLVKIAKSSYRLSECIVQSAPLVRNAFRGKAGSQELVENWYSFATEHGTRASIHIEPNAWDRFSRLLMRLAISWISFISQECNPTDRKTFRWTVAALTYAFNMTRGSNILALDRSEFSLLRRYVGVCVSLLVSHFDILGARSSMEAKKEAERIEAMRRLQRLQENLDDEFLPRTPIESGGQPRIDRSIRLTVEERLRLIAELEARRSELATAPVGQVLDEEVSEDRALVFLAASKSNISMRWQQGAYIGGGASGSVYLGYSLQDNTVFAVKILPTVDLQSSPALYESIKRESDVMSLLSHPNIVGFLGLEVHRNRVCLFQEVSLVVFIRVEKVSCKAYVAWYSTVKEDRWQVCSSMAKLTMRKLLGHSRSSCCVVLSICMPTALSTEISSQKVSVHSSFGSFYNTHANSPPARYSHRRQLGSQAGRLWYRQNHQVQQDARPYTWWWTRQDGGSRGYTDVYGTRDDQKPEDRQARCLRYLGFRVYRLADGHW